VKKQLFVIFLYIYAKMRLQRLKSYKMPQSLIHQCHPV